MSIQRIIEIPLDEVQTDKAKDTDISLNFCCCICAKPLRKAGDYKLVHITNRNTIVSTDQDIDNKICQYKQWLVDSSHKEERRQLAKHGITFHRSCLPFYQKAYRIGKRVVRRSINRDKYIIIEHITPNIESSPIPDFKYIY